MEFCFVLNSGIEHFLLTGIFSNFYNFSSFLEPWIFKNMIEQEGNTVSKQAFFKKKIFVYVSFCLRVCVCIYALYVGALCGAHGGQRRMSILWIWSYRQLCIVLWMLGTEPRSPASVPSAPTSQLSPQCSEKCFISLIKCQKDFIQMMIRQKIKLDLWGFCFKFQGVGFSLCCSG